MPTAGKILIVEDEPAVLNVCAAVLRRNGFDCIVTANGVDALHIYQDRRKEIGVVISDIAMPVMSGIELMQKVFEIHEHAKVILMSGYHLSELVLHDLRRLCSVIEKPFTPATLVQAVKKCLRDAERDCKANS